MVIPTFRGPGYGAEFAQTLRDDAAKRLESMINAREIDADLAKGALAQSEKIAGIGGSQALTNILSAVAPDIGGAFNTPYAAEADVWRKQGALADIARTNRSGTGGGGGSDSDKVKIGQIVGSDGNTYKDIEDLMMWNMATNQQITPVQYGPKPSGAAPAVTPAPVATTPAAPVPVTVSPDGTKTYSDGSILHPDGSFEEAPAKAP